MLEFALLLVNFLLVQSSMFYDIKNVHSYFEDFITTHNKQYQSEEEWLLRLTIFEKNLVEINRGNEESTGAVFGITQFTDLTEREFLAYYTGLKLNYEKTNCSEPSETNSSISAPDAFDWRSQKVVSRVKKQGRCGSCWAFGAAGAVESQYAIKNKILLELSEQQLVDCDDRSSGCHGTTALENPFFYYLENGAMLEKDYPYEANDKDCRYDKSKVKVQIKGCRLLKINNDEEILKKFLHQYGPATIGIDASPLQNYKGGIVQSQQCKCERLNHAVLLVGYGSEKNVPYWIVKNSWSGKWGEEGYFRIERNVNCLNIQLMPSVQPVLA